MNGCPSAVVFDHVVKEYPQRWGNPALRALDDVSFHVAPGQIFGLVGPNRAGKTTLVKLLLSLCHPTRGRVERLGRPGTERRTLARIGYVHESPAFPKHLTATALLEYYGALTLLPEPQVKAIVPRLLEQVGLADRAREPIARFSKGMLQRLGLAQALLNDPDLLVLDEPSEGLDLGGRQLLRDMLTRQRARGKSVFYVTHLLAEVEQLCDRIAVLVAGRLRFAGTVHGLMNEAAGMPQSLDSALQNVYRLSDRKELQPV